MVTQVAPSADCASSVDSSLPLERAVQAAGPSTMAAARGQYTSMDIERLRMSVLRETAAHARSLRCGSAWILRSLAAAHRNARARADRLRLSQEARSEGA